MSWTVAGIGLPSWSCVQTIKKGFEPLRQPKGEKCRKNKKERLSGESWTINKLQYNKILAEALRGMARAITVEGTDTMMSTPRSVLNPLGFPQASSSPSSSNFEFKNKLCPVSFSPLFVFLIKRSLL